MTKFDELMKGDDKPESIPFEGSYQCQTCGETVYAAEYFPGIGGLRWKCSKGHRSVIEEFNLF